MIYNFKYLSPRTREELYDILAKYESDAALLSGGTDLLVNIRNAVIRPKYVVDIKKIDGLSQITWDKDGNLVIQAGVTINDMLRCKEIRTNYPILAACAHDLASYQIRNRATLVGNVANASPCSDMSPALLCLQAEAVIKSKNGERKVPFYDFFKGVKKTTMLPGEMLERIIVPKTTAGAKGDYRKLKRINGHDLAIVGVALIKYNEDIKIGISSAAPTPVLVDNITKNDSVDDIISKVMGSVNPISDLRCTKEYREHMIKVFVRRLLEEVK